MTRGLAAVCLFLFSMSVSPADAARTVPPPPPPRPAAVPLPPERPTAETVTPDSESAEKETGKAGTETKVETNAPPAITKPTRPQLLTESDEDFAACQAVLDQLGVTYTVLDKPVTSTDPECGIARPVSVQEIQPGVTLQPDSRLRCATALALAEWVRDFVVPATERLENRGRLTAIDHGSTYVCRRRNNAKTGKLSEHSFGNAVDIMGFRFSAGSSIRIRPRQRTGKIEESFQRAVRAASCLNFTTVIGPGTDASHADHLHLDIKKRSGGWRLCQ
ncbi:extensin family protein [Minwuia sp.]|uniref:extensin-like domain-containing protein n=1 Tax=Minwuia sp. TaxID=2493630 RepID=UPI003A951A20